MRILASRKEGLHSAAAALAWLYLYSAIWLIAYAILATVVFGWKPVVVTGGSMEPLIGRGDVVMVSTAQEAFGRGTVITFRSRTGQGMVTHRITKVSLSGYETRGDANAVADSDIVRRPDVYGAGRLLIPLIGRPYVWIRERALVPLGLWLLVSAGALAVVTRREDKPAASAADAAPVRRPVYRPRLA
jgi:signal peptidase